MENEALQPIHETPFISVEEYENLTIYRLSYRETFGISTDCQRTYCQKGLTAALHPPANTNTNRTLRARFPFFTSPLTDIQTENDNQEIEYFLELLWIIMCIFLSQIQ